MARDVSVVSIRCLGHGGAASLSEAVLNGWRMCERCHLFICPDCAKAFEEEREGICPGSQTIGRHKMQLVDIPTDEVLLFVQHSVEAPSTGPLVYEVFFRGKAVELDPFASAVSAVRRRPPPTDDPLAVLRREHWKRFGAVMVKRRRGRYVTWGPVG